MTGPYAAFGVPTELRDPIGAVLSLRVADAVARIGCDPVPRRPTQSLSPSLARTKPLTWTP